MNIKNNIIKFLKVFDAFGETHTFRVNTEKTYNSPVGGCFCLLFTIYTAYYILFTFSEFMDGKYKTKEYDLKIDTSPQIEMKNHQYFSIAFCIRNEKYEVDKFLSENLEMNFFYVKSKFENKILITENKEILLQNCASVYNNNTNLLKITDHQKQYWDILNNFQLDGCKCVNFDEIEENFIFSSKLEAVEKNSFMINLKLNKNSTQVYDYINQNNPKFHIYFPEYSADIYSNEEPLPIKLHTENFELSTQFTHASEIYLGLLSFTDYYSYTQDDLFNFKNKLIFDTKNNYKLNQIKENCLMRVNFILSGNSITYKRNYLKIQEYLGNVVGYLWNLILVVYIVSWIYNNFGAKRFLSEKFFMSNKKLKNLLKNVKGYRNFRKNRITKNKSKILLI